MPVQLSLITAAVPMAEKQQDFEVNPGDSIYYSFLTETGRNLLHRTYRFGRSVNRLLLCVDKMSKTAEFCGTEGACCK